MATNPEDYHEEMEEVEVTDGEYEDEAGSSGGVRANQNTPLDSENDKGARMPTSSSKPFPTPGKISPSEPVRKLVHRTPESVSARPLPGISTDKNPFPSYGVWTSKTLSEIDISIPVLSARDETTNELTRSSRPEARYWRAPIIFKYGNFTSDTLRFNNVQIPYHTGKGYGSSYIYLCLPGFVGEAMAEAGKTRRPTKVHENSLVPDKARWWKVANKVEDAFGVINATTKNFHKKSIETLLDGTKNGLTANVVLAFNFKASTEDKSPIKSTTTGTISIELRRGYIESTDVNVQMPTRVSYKKTRAEPSATTHDIAADSLMKRLAEIGL